MRITQNFVKLMMGLFFSCILTGCGFHLRNVTILPVFAQKIYLNTSFPYSSFTQQLKVGLRYVHAECVDDPKKASLTLNISNESFVLQQNSLASSQQTRSYQLVYTVLYSVKDSRGNLLADQRSLVTQSSLALFPNEQVTGNAKMGQAKERMEQDLVAQLTAQLAALKDMSSAKKVQGSSL